MSIVGPTTNCQKAKVSSFRDEKSYLQQPEIRGVSKISCVSRCKCEIEKLCQELKQKDNAYDSLHCELAKYDERCDPATNQSELKK
jgi:hypothetical protein